MENQIYFETCILCSSTASACLIDLNTVDTLVVLSLCETCRKNYESWNAYPDWVYLTIDEFKEYLVMYDVHCT
jgi:hypothetical protein